MIVPDRGLEFEFGATVYRSHELPEPELPSGRVIHDTSLDADQLHDVVVEMKALLVEPLAPAETVVGETL